MKQLTISKKNNLYQNTIPFKNLAKYSIPELWENFLLSASCQSYSPDFLHLK